jgi:hypothetical protein
MRRENAIPSCPANSCRRGTPRHGRQANPFARGHGTAQDARRTVRAVRSLAASRLRRHTSRPRRPCRVRLGQPVAELPLEIVMWGDGPPARIAALTEWRY